MGLRAHEQMLYEAYGHMSKCCMKLTGTWANVVWSLWAHEQMLYEAYGHMTKCCMKLTGTWANVVWSLRAHEQMLYEASQNCGSFLLKKMNRSSQTICRNSIKNTFVWHIDELWCVKAISVKASPQELHLQYLYGRLSEKNGSLD